MKIAYYLNLTAYLTIIGFYIYEPAVGAISQFFLGIFQLVFATKLSFTFNPALQKNRKYLNYYWRSILIWIILIIIGVMLPETKYTFSILILGLSMVIGLYFVIVTYLIQKE